MNELGLSLREAREGLGISLAEAEDRTRIRQKFVAAMETEDWDALPGEVTTRGFLRKYATFLGLDPDTTVAQYQRRANIAPGAGDLTEPTVERPIDYRPIEMNLTEEPPRQVPWRSIVAVLLVLALVAAVWWVISYRPGWINTLTSLPQDIQSGAFLGPEPTATATAVEEVSNRITATPTATVEATATPQPVAAPVDETPPAAETPQADETSAVGVTDEPVASVEPEEVVVETIRFDLRTLARSWVRLVIDGQVVMESILEQDEGGQWDASKSIVLRTGNAAGVKVTLNDKALPFLGGAGEVIERQWRLENGAIVETTPTPIPVATNTPAP